MSYDFTRLTPAQEWLICLNGWHIGKRWPDGTPYVQPTKRTVRKLIERGLIVPREVTERAGQFSMRVIEYDVPLDVHLAYCSQCEVA